MWGSLILITFILIFRVLFKELASNHNEKNSVKIFLIVFGIVMGALPIILVKEGLLSNSVFNILISVGAAIYFPILISRIIKKH